MTVRELIAHLSTLPPELPVIYQYHSDYEELTAEQVREEDVSYRNGAYRTYYPYAIYPLSESPEYRRVVVFPGN